MRPPGAERPHKRCMRCARAVLLAAPLLCAGMAPAEQGAGASNDVAGADPGGKSTEKELSGDAAAVEGRRNAAMARRPRAAADSCNSGAAQPNTSRSRHGAGVGAQALVEVSESAQHTAVTCMSFNMHSCLCVKIFIIKMQFDYIHYNFVLNLFYSYVIFFLTNELCLPTIQLNI